MDPSNPHWGWSWLERWLAARPWETATTSEKESSNNNSPHVTNGNSIFSGNEITKSYARRHLIEKPSPTTSIPKQTRSSTGRLSTSNAPSNMVSSTVGARKLRSSSPKVSPRASMRTSMWGGPDDDARSTISEQSEQSRRNSIAGSSVRDDESLASSQTVPSYMAPTQSAKAKSRLGSESKMNNNRSVTPDRLSVSSAKKRLSYPPSPAKSRHSTSSIGDSNSVSEHT